MSDIDIFFVSLTIGYMVLAVYILCARVEL